MQPEEVKALGDIGSEAIASVATQVRSMHEAIARRVFDSIGPGAAPVRLVHDRIADSVHTSVRVALGSLTRAGAALAGARRREDAASIDESTAGRIALGAINGAFGDALAQRGNALALPMTLRRRGRDVATTPAGLRAAFPDG